MTIEIEGEVRILADRNGLSDDEFRAMRRTYLGGSDAGAILRMSTYSSPLSVYCEKKGLAVTEDNEFMLWGRILEPVIRDQFASRHPELKIETDPRIYRHDEIPWMGGTIDGRATNEAGVTFGLEIKTGSEYSKEWGDDELPDRYYAQVQHYMALLGLPGFWVVALLGRKMVERFVPRNEAFIADMLVKEQEFWQECIVKDTMPDPIGLECDGDLLAEMYSEAVEKDPVPDLGQDAEIIAGSLEGIQAELKDLEADEAECKQKLQALMGDTKIATAGHYQLTWSRWETKRFNSKEFKKDHPEEYEKYQTQKVNTGRFSMKFIAEKSAGSMDQEE